MATTLPTPVFWLGGFHGVTKSRRRLSDFHFTSSAYFTKGFLLVMRSWCHHEGISAFPDTKRCKHWDLYFLGLQTHCRWSLQPWHQKTLATWKKSYDQPEQHVKKQRHCFADKCPSSQIMFFSAVMYGYESWTIKKAECQRTDAFKLWFWRLLRVCWTARRSNQ